MKLNRMRAISVLLIILLVLGLAMPSDHILSIHAEEVSETSGSSGGNDSGSGDSGGNSSSEGSDNSSSTESGGSSGSESSDSSGSSNEETSGEQNGSEDSGGEEESTTTGDGSETVSSEEEKSDEESTEGKSADSEDTEEEAETEEETVKPVKKVYKDDSKGRDYSDSEIISSGNTSFTIVSVVRNHEKIEKKLNNLKKKKKKLVAKKKKLCAKLAEDQKEASDIQSVYDMLNHTGSDEESIELQLTGCLREGTYLPKPDRIEGLDDRLAFLAETYGNDYLTEWVEQYTTEYLPQSIQISEITYENSEGTGEETAAYSSVEPVLANMAGYCEVAIAAGQKQIADVKAQIKDVNEHIKIQKEIKLANTIELDSRLEEYKDRIPDETVEFLNAVVAKEGTPYVWGASGPNAFDCSGLVSYGLRECQAAGPGFRWTSYDFAVQLRSIPFEEAVPGDLVWKHGHIAIYIDEDTVFEAPYKGARIRFTSCNVSSRFNRVLRWWGEDDE